jgi:hypothetical protein
MQPMPPEEEKASIESHKKKNNEEHAPWGRGGVVHWFVRKTLVLTSAKETMENVGECSPIVKH